jgi:ubiquinone/menaquinone biosynthesis C-methylase UbiE
MSIARYGSLAPEYDRACRYIDKSREAAVEALEVAEGQTVVDVGCGTGATLAALAERVGRSGRVIGIEHSPSMLALARARVAASGLADRVTLVESGAERAVIPDRIDALLFCYTHDVLQSPDALENLFRNAKPGARVAVVGTRLQPWWRAAPINLWVCARGWRYLTTFRGLGHPWRPLLDYCPDVRMLDTFHLGSSYLAAGRYRG